MKIFPRKNIGTIDRVARAVLGVLFLVYAVFGQHGVVPRVILLVIAIFCLYQAVAGWCLWYQIIGKNTCPVSEKG